MKLLILGHGGHGKDSLADAIAEATGLTFQCSSMAAAEAILPELRKRGLDYRDAQHAYSQRRSYRALWYELITAYNTPDATRLARKVLAESDGYVGMRSRREVDACKAAGLFDLVLWVDASEREPLEPESSMSATVDDTDLVIDNNGPKGCMQVQVQALARHIEEWRMRNE